MGGSKTKYASGCLYPIGQLTSPISYEQINLYNSLISPSTVHCQNTNLVWFFSKYLLQRAFSIYKFRFPDYWDKDYAKYTLFINGFFAVINTSKYGIIPQQCSLSGINVYYRPNRVLIANPLIMINKELVIGTDTELVRLQPDYSGIIDIVAYIADNMALTAEACGVNTINSKLSFWFMTDDKASAESYKKAYDSYTKGDPMVVTGGKDLFADGENNYEFFNKDVGGSYIVDQLMVALRQWELIFDNYVGIPNNPVSKKERVITSEVESNNVETRTLSDTWLECLKESISKVNRMFGLDIGVEYKYKMPEPETEGSEKGERVDIRSRAS